MKHFLIAVSREKDKYLEVTYRLKTALVETFTKQYVGEPLVDIVEIEEIGNLEKPNHFYDFAFVVGGDGSILRTAHLLRGSMTYIIGINLGRRGFMAQVEVEDIEKAVKAIERGEYSVKAYPFLAGYICNNGKVVDSATAINDILIAKSDMLRTVNLELNVDNQFVGNYICDGILVSTAWGSTAYNRALGGPVVKPESGINIITPIGTADKTFSSLVVPNTSSIEIKVIKSPENSKVKVGYDGTQDVFELKDEDIIKIEGNRTYFNMLNFEDYNYYSNLREKLKI